MKPLLTLILLFLWTATMPAQTEEKRKQPLIKENEIPKIEFAFQSYKTALIHKDGHAAARELSKDSIQIYDYYRQAALTGTKAELLQVPLVHQAAILVLRGSTPAEELSRETGEDTYARSVEQGLIAHNWAEAMELLNVEIVEENTALLNIGVKGKQGATLVAVREGPNWKISLRELLDQTNETIVQMLLKKNIQPEAYLQAAVAGSLGKEFTPDLWDPPSPRASHGQESQVNLP